MPWIRYWAKVQSKASGAFTEKELWRHHQELPSEDSNEEIALELGDKFFRHRSGYTYGFDEPLEVLPEEKRLELLLLHGSALKKEERIISLLGGPRVNTYTIATDSFTSGLCRLLMQFVKENPGLGGTFEGTVGEQNFKLTLKEPKKVKTR